MAECCSARGQLLEHRDLLTTVTLFPSQDTSLFEEPGGTLANGAGEYLFVGSTAPRNNDLVRRGLISFDLTEHIPPGSSINSVSLTLNMSKTITGDQPVSLHFVLNEWGEGTSDAPGEEGRGTIPSPGDATWIHRQFPSENWDSPKDV